LHARADMLHASCATKATRIERPHLSVVGTSPEPKEESPEAKDKWPGL